jgi:ketosteroid isomerase-like protein
MLEGDVAELLCPGELAGTLDRGRGDIDPERTARPGCPRGLPGRLPGPAADVEYGVTGTDVVAAEALDTAAKSPGSRETYTKAEMAYAITELLGYRDTSRILPMLRQDFVLKIPATLPYGGEFTGPEAFARFFAGTPGGAEVWESFDVHVDQVIESADYLVAQLTNTAVPKATGKTVVIQNVWLFEVAGGRLVSAQLYADTAGVRSSAG